MDQSEAVLEDVTDRIWCIPKDVCFNGRRLTEDEVLDALEAGRHGALSHLASPVPYRQPATSS